MKIEENGVSTNKKLDVLKVMYGKIGEKKKKGGGDNRKKDL